MNNHDRKPTLVPIKDIKELRNLPNGITVIDDWEDTYRKSSFSEEWFAVGDEYPTSPEAIGFPCWKIVWVKI